MQRPILILGGGLSGLALAYFLHQKNQNFLLFEASSRLGGRIQTIYGALGTPLEVGATWFSVQHPHLLSLMGELNLTHYPQFASGKSLFQTKSFEPPQEFHVSDAEMPSFRLAGGTEEIIRTLASKLPPENIFLEHTGKKIQETTEGVTIQMTDGQSFSGSAVVLCLPPELVQASFAFQPPLPPQVQELLPTVQTWMAGSIKFVLEYETPFWREAGYSGMLYSHAGIVTEMYDHTNFEGTRFGFTGFLNSGAAQFSQEVRKEWVLKQLVELLGSQMGQPTYYFDQVWNHPLLVGGPQTIQRPHQNNGHATLQKPYWNGKLFFGGTETSAHTPGYMEGAIQAAKRNVQWLLG